MNSLVPYSSPVAGAAPMGLPVFDSATYDAVPRQHVPGVALMFEGGGMRASYSAGMIAMLLEEGIDFDYTCGVSAGASCAVNYISGSVWRSKVAFCDIVTDKRFGGVGSWLRGKGYFNSDWIYQHASEAGGPMPLQYRRFAQSPKDMQIQAFDADTGETVIWSKSDIASLTDLMVKVQASSSLPIMMPPVKIDGHTYFDGGMGTGGGITAHLALDAGYDRIFAVLTRPKGYRKPLDGGVKFRAGVALYRRYPRLQEALSTRARRYNAALDALELMAAEGRAYIFYADKMGIGNSTTHRLSLEQSYADGYTQARRELPRIKEWLGL